MELRSWRTTILGSSALMTIVGRALTAIFDIDPTTNVDWATVIPALLTAIGLIFARDQKAHDKGR